MRCTFAYLCPRKTEGVGLSVFKNIILDLGGMLLNIDPDRTYHKLAALGGIAANTIKDQGGTLANFADCEMGLITTEEFRRQVRTHLNTDVPDAQLDEAWNAMLLDLPTERLELLKKIASTHRAFLLGNTNEIHWLAFHAIFEYVLQAHQLLPGETLFVDDTFANVTAARQLGITAFHLCHPNQLFQIFR